MESKLAPIMKNNGHITNEPLPNDQPIPDSSESDIDDIIDYIYGELPFEERSVLEDKLCRSTDHWEWFEGQLNFRAVNRLTTAEEHKILFKRLADSLDIERIVDRIQAGH